jgi:hypothetical protein
MNKLKYETPRVDIMKIYGEMILSSQPHEAAGKETKWETDMMSDNPGNDW